MEKAIVPDNIRSLHRKYDGRLKIVFCLGTAGDGKTTAMESLRRTIMREYPHYQLDLVNMTGVAAAAAYARHQVAERTKEAECFQVQLDTGDIVLFVAWAAEEAFIRGEFNIPELLAALDAMQVDVMTLCVNPFIHNSELAAYSFVELSWYLQQHFNFNFEQASNVAAELLWGIKPQGLLQLNCEWDQLTAEQRRNIRLQRQPAARFGQSLTQAFRMEGDANGEAILLLMKRVAETVGADDMAFSIVREIVKRRPHQVIVANTFHDLLTYLPGVGNDEFLNLSRKLFVQPQTVRMNQIIAQSSVNFVLRDNVVRPIFKQGVNTESKVLAHSILSQLRSTPKHASRSQVPSRWILAAASIPLLVGACIAPGYGMLLASCILAGMLAYGILWVWTQRRGWWLQRQWKKTSVKAGPGATSPAVPSPAAPSLKTQAINRLAESNHVLQTSRG